MKRSVLAAALSLVAIILAGYSLVAVSAKPISYVLPEETATLKPGPNLEAAQ